EQLAELLRQLGPRSLRSLRLRIRPSRAVLLTELRNLGLQPLNIIRQAGFLDLLKRLLLIRGKRSLGRGLGLLGLYSVVFRHDDPLDQSGVGLLALGNLRKAQRDDHGDAATA